MNDSDIFESGAQMEKPKESKCVWNITGAGSECVGDVETIGMFPDSPTGALQVPICKEHLDHHEKIMVLYKSGRDIDKLVGLTKEEIDKEIAEL